MRDFAAGAALLLGLGGCWAPYAAPVAPVREPDVQGAPPLVGTEAALGMNDLAQTIDFTTLPLSKESPNASGPEDE